MKSANLKEKLVDLDVKGCIELPDLSLYSVKSISKIIELCCPTEAVSTRTIQRAIKALDLEPEAMIGNAFYFCQLHAEAILLYLKFKVKR
jgi:hypothetical protein